MHTYGEGCIIILNLFGDVKLGALKNTDVVCSKFINLLTTWSLGIPPPMVNASMITLVKLLELDPSKTQLKEIKIRILTQFSTT
jgi:hypothetical protein